VLLQEPHLESASTWPGSQVLLWDQACNQHHGNKTKGLRNDNLPWHWSSSSHPIFLVLGVYLVPCSLVSACHLPSSVGFCGI